MNVRQYLGKFEAHARSYYVTPQGEQTRQASNFAHALAPVRDLFAELGVNAFRAPQLTAVRNSMIGRGLSRKTINARANMIRQAWRWGVPLEVVEPDTLASLQAVPALKYGRSAAKETAGVKPADLEVVRRTLPELSETVGDIVRVLVATGCRLSEARCMRGEDIDATDEAVWVCRPAHHKTRHLGHERTIMLGPEAQRVIAPRLLLHGRGYLFPSPRNPGEPYNRDAMNVAITRACKRIGVEKWSALQIRHSVATRIRRDYGIDAARTVLGHQSVDVTGIYAERDQTEAARIARRIG